MKRKTTTASKRLERIRVRPTNTNSIFGNYKPIEPLTENQGKILEAFRTEKNLVLIGYPGTGKTWMACAYGVHALMKGEYEQIRIIRSSVPSRDMGFLPGNEREKMEVYERPYIATFNSLLKRDDAYGVLKTKSMVTFESSSYLRGVTYDNSIIIVDEFQNLSYPELHTIMTRVGIGSKIIFCGDLQQADLREKETGFNRINTILERMPDFFSMHEMTADDIVRSDIVKRFIIESERLRCDEKLRKVA